VKECNRTNDVDEIEYGYCEDADYEQLLYLRYISVRPWPVLFLPGENISVLAHIELFEEIPDNSTTVTFNILKEADGVNITIPCVNNFGSCTYDGNYFLQTYLSGFFCPDSEDDCSLPIPSGHYGEDCRYPYWITIDYDIMMDWMLFGTFYVDISVNTAMGPFTCISFVLELEDVEESTPGPTPHVPHDHCTQCEKQLGETFKDLANEPWITNQKDYLFMNACVDAEDSGSCQQYVGDHWPSMAKECLFTDTQEWSLNNFTCLYFGSCQDNNIYWGCYEVTDTLATTLNHPSTVEGVTNQLDTCYCSKQNLNQTECQTMIGVVTSPALAALSSWVSDTQQELCNQNIATSASLPIVTIIVSSLLYTFYR